MEKVEFVKHKNVIITNLIRSGRCNCIYENRKLVSFALGIVRYILTRRQKIQVDSGLYCFAVSDYSNSNRVICLFQENIIFVTYSHIYVLFLFNKTNYCTSFFAHLQKFDCLIQCTVLIILAFLSVFLYSQRKRLIQVHFYLAFLRLALTMECISMYRQTTI